MSEKSPISLLQELTQSKKLPSPVYSFEEIEGPKFRCTVRVSGKTYVGISTTKRQAKSESARIALEKLQTTNYAGELNDYAAKNHVGFPAYEYLPTTMKSGEFIVNCSFSGCDALGKGKSKKEAKQNAAKNMIELYLNKEKCVVETEKKANEEGKKKKSGNVTGLTGEKSTKEAKTKKSKTNKNISGCVADGLGAENLEKIVATINALGLNKEGKGGSGSKSSGLQIVINLQK